MPQEAVKVSGVIVIPQRDPKIQGGYSMPQMLLPIFTSDVTLINQLIGFAKGT